MINREELAWAAGFFDGEGHVRAVGRGHVRVQLAQVEKEPLERFQRAVLNLGKFYGPYEQGHRPVWHFRTHNFEESQAVIALLWNFLSGPKRQQILAVFKSLKLRIKGFCKNGHDLQQAYLYIGDTGLVQRHCRICQTDRARQRIRSD
jgi:LAGLIDADG DNA endonuclease family protein